MKVMILGVDGFLGWTLALFLGKKGHSISGVDNFARRDWVAERGAATVVPIARMTERLRAAKREGITIDFRDIDILKQRNLLAEFIDEVKPDHIVHYGECPSPAYSMIDVDHACYVQENNVLGTLGLLFIMRDICPDATLIKLGTMGEYHPSSFYHVSKKQDSENIMHACETWGLKAYDIMQGIIYGSYGEGDLATRLDIDECFGTVVHRFVAQAVIDKPITIYGNGEQVRGFIALEDAMRCMELYINRPLSAGQYEVINQRTISTTIKRLSTMVSDIAYSCEFGMAGKISNIENPRVELDVINYNASYDRLDSMGFIPQITLQEGITSLFRTMVPERIESVAHLLNPRIGWSGKKGVYESTQAYF